MNIEEIKRPETDAQLVAERIALDLENRVTFRRAMKQAMGRTMKFGAKGIKTAVSGRLGGADIARTESYHDGTSPCRHCAQTSTTASQKLIQHTANWA